MHPMTGAITLPRIPARFLLVAALHAALIYMVNDALRFDSPLPDDVPLTGRWLPQKPSPLPPGPPEPPQTYDPTRPVMVGPLPPPPGPDVTEPADEAASASSTSAGTSSGAITAGAPLPAPTLRPVRTDPRWPLTQPDYPASAIRLEQEGTVVLAIRVTREGRIAEVRVAQSSGHASLDRAAVEEARRNWRLLPARRGDAAIEEWGSFRVVFRLENR